MMHEPAFKPESILFRFIHHNKFGKEIPGKPSASMFDPHPSGISLDWNKFTTASGVLVRVGLSYKFGSREIFKNHFDYRLIKLNVGEIVKIDEITGLKHTPSKREPEQIGQPNNPSHCTLKYMDEEVRLKLVELSKVVIKLDRLNISKKIDAKKSDWGVI